MSDLLPLTMTQAMVRRRGKLLLGPVDLVLDGVGTTIVIGPNGAGKTTLLKMMHGIARLSGGEIRWACSRDRARRKQAFVFQTPVVLRRSVRDNLLYPLKLISTPRREAEAIVETWAGRVGLGDALGRPAMVLSGGERQKLALARAMVRDPDVLFLDEPCSSLDGRATREIEEILGGVSKLGTRIVMSTHDMGQARRLADEVIFVLNSKIPEHGAAAGFFDAPATRQAQAFLNGDIVE
ncbi:ATP-binding cassette domain-containing protein [Shimia sp.]|uniref:ATP-binding cassette domain-containing protein n=1 Tax=Shimia sp. TaxID=1954381 RepID=UPI003564C84D